MKVKQLRPILEAYGTLQEHSGNTELSESIRKLEAMLRDWDHEDVAALVARVKAFRAARAS